MATAPTPGVGARTEANASKLVLTITVHRPIMHAGRQIPDSHEIAPALIPIRERTICRKATGLPPAAYYGSEDAMDIDSMAVLWWLARRANGEATLTWQQAEAEWPLDLTPDELAVEVDDGTGDEGDDSPEG